MLVYDPSSGYLHDILEQPAALEATRLGLEAGIDLEDLPERLARGEFQRLVLTGMGSSYHVLQPMFYHLAQQRTAAVLMETGELIHQAPQLLDPQALVIAVSQSGRSAETLLLLELAADRGAPVIGVTNTAGSPLDVRSTARILTCAGEESNVSCKTYISGLLALHRLALELTGQSTRTAAVDARPVVDAARAYLDRWREHCASLEGTLKNIEHIFLVGRGASLAACGTGGLITKKSAHVHAEGMSSAAFRHGPMEMLSENCFALVFAGDEKGRDLNYRLYEELCSIGIPAGWVAPTPGDGPFCLPAVPAGLLPILEILPVEMMTLALARLRGRTAGIFTRGTKVTTSE